MAWTTNQVTQNGNTTVTWIATGSALSTHDCVVAGLTSGTNSCIRIDSIERCVDPTSYRIRITVIGSQAVAFRCYAEQMD